jgi:hypothetical protein
MAKKCLCTSPVPNFDGTCSTCGKLLTWEANLDWESAASEETTLSEVPSRNPKKTPPRANLSSQLNSAANEVVRFSTVFKSIGDTLNVLNYIFIGVIVLSLLVILFTGNASVWLFLGAILFVLVVWIISWIQTGLLRGISSFFLMRGLRELKDLESK